MGVTFRDRCLTTLASVQLAPSEAEQPSFFRSQFVVAAFAAANAPLFKGDAQWLSPADLLHMRNGDVTTYDVPQPLNYVGHLKRWDLKEILSLRRATP